MAKFINPHLRFIDQFLTHFKPCFTKIQWPMFRQYIYAAFADYKRPSIEAFAEQLNISYQKLQYFFSEADWDIHQLNAIRLKILGQQPTTRATTFGVLAIDHTAGPKPYAEKTEGPQFQSCGPLKRKENCNVAVASCFVSESKHFPIEFKSYLPIEAVEAKDFKSKLDLAKDLIDNALLQNIPVSTIVVDNWYASSEFIEFVASKNLDLISEVKSNRSILFTDPKSRQWRHYSATALTELIKTTFAHKIKNVVIQHKDDSNKSIPTFSFISRIKDCQTKLKIIFLFDSWSDFDEQKAHVLISTDIVSSDKKIISTYLLRWGIEENFRELKDNFAFDQYQVRHQKQIQRHWILSFLAWSIAYWIKQNACLSKDHSQTAGKHRPVQKIRRTPSHLRLHSSLIKEPGSLRLSRRHQVRPVHRFITGKLTKYCYELKYSSLLILLMRQLKTLDRDQERADGDRAVGHVEHRPNP